MSASNNGGQFGFGPTPTTKNSVAEPENSATPQTSNVEQEDLNKEYIDRRSITIALKTYYSLYRRANDKTLPKRTDYIGSCITSSRVLSANKEEVETYFPNLIGLAPNNELFTTRVKQYLGNIRVQVNELGKTFNTTFHYYHKSDYLNIKKQEDLIEAEYAVVNRQDISALKKALALKIEKINALESSKCKLGYPENIEEYLLYRHCLLYKDVAKDVSLINDSPDIRFYFKDDRKEAEKLKKYRLEVNKAKANYVACLADDDLFDAIYIKYCAEQGLPIISSLNKERIDREIQLDKFSADEPVKFNKIFANKDIKIIALIERLIARGELIRSTYNQNISTAENEFVGANMNEAIAWFKNPDNNAVVTAYQNKLKNI